MRFLVLGSKEYPAGSSVGFDPLPSGGFETYTQNLAKALEKEGQDVLLVSRRFPNQAAFEKKGRISVFRVPWIPGFYLRTPSFVLLSFLRALFLDFDVILAHGPLSGFMALKLRFLKGKPVIARPAGIASIQPQYPSLLRSMLGALEGHTYRHADLVVFLSEGEKANFQTRFGYLPKNHVIIPTGVFVPKVSRTTKENAVLFVGRLLSVKGVSYLVSAMKGIKAKLWIVGDGPEKMALESQAKDAEVSAEFFGHQKNVTPYLSRAKIFCLPSLSEGLPVALLEAYAHGLACVVTDIGLPAEDGKTALVVPPKNALALRAALKKLLARASLRNRLSINARALARTFTWEKTARKYVQAAEKLV